MSNLSVASLRSSMQALLTLGPTQERTDDKSHGWYSYRPLNDAIDVQMESVSLAPNPDIERFLHVSHVAVLRHVSVIEFYWTDERVRQLTYLTAVNVEGVKPEDLLDTVSKRFTKLLCPGWRDTVHRTWITPNTVLIRKVNAGTRVLDEHLDTTWNRII